MGINVRVTNVDRDSNNITFTQDGLSRTLPVVLPAQIKWAKEGDAEVSINQEGNVNFIKSLEPKPHASDWNKAKPGQLKKAVTSPEVFEEVTPKEYKVIYDGINATEGKECMAATIKSRADGKYDVFIYVKTFVPISSV